MAGHLSVDGTGLNAAGNSSMDVAEALAASTANATSGDRPSDGGVSALDGALGAVRARQSARASRQGADMLVASAKYADTDGGTADGILRTV